MNQNLPVDSIKTVAVTGASGALGFSLLQELKRRNIKSRALITETDNRIKLENYCSEIIVGSVVDKECCHRLLNGVDAVINCAALLPTSLYLGQDAFYSVNVNGGMNIGEVAEELGLKRAVFLSTIGVVDHTLETRLTDLSRYRTSYLDAYSSSKIELEKQLVSAISKNKLDITIIRPVFIYGPNSLGLWTSILTEIKRGTFKILGDGKGYFPMIHEKDLAVYILDCLEQKINKSLDGVVIAGGHYEATTFKVFSLLAQAMGRRSPQKIPIFIAYAAATIADLLPNLFRIGPLKLLTKRRVIEYSKGYDLSQILKLNNFGFQNQISLEAGLTEMVRAYERANEI